MLKLHVPLSTLAVISGISETPRAAALASGQVLGVVWGMLPSYAKDLCPVWLMHSKVSLLSAGV